MHQAIWGDSEQATWSKHDLCIMIKCRHRIPWHIPLFYLEKHEGRYHNVWHFYLSDMEQSKKYMSRPVIVTATQWYVVSFILSMPSVPFLTPYSCFARACGSCDTMVHIAQHASRLPVNGIVISNGMGFASSTSDAGSGREIKILTCNVEKIEESVSISTVFLLIEFLSVPLILDCSLLYSPNKRLAITSYQP